MTLETLLQQQEQLRRQVVDLMFQVHNPDLGPLRDLDRDTPERALLTELERQLEEKREQLRLLDQQVLGMCSPWARFRETSRRMRTILWLCAGCMLLAAVLAGLCSDGHWALAFGVLAALMAVWAVWASLPSDP
ncbi:MAG TPA: hypothetical protein H9714_02580 [Candidatus Flavonifractor intestinipullorum]|uniref:Uncharacterized protein n=1 Tax=Candidatus Flavonifractor intestinipullorum TaxID=2838587 RepID=A0A9D2M9B5_9FIRM|nr:hypothetical protein [Candidatus Flavonifractor intestinipullorum]